MDKYEYKLKSEQMLEFMEDGAYNKAAEIADTIDWRRVRNATMLTNVSDIYEKNREYQKSYDILNIAYQRAEGSRKILYRLCVLALKTKNVDEAIDYYDEFVQTAPKDPNRYLLRYQILRARKEPIEQQIEALEAFKKGEYIEEWAYELAKLYQEAGMTAECLEECDDLILWFSEGKYVYQAMELKMRYKPLTPSQQEKYNRRYEKSGTTEEIPGIVEYKEEKEKSSVMMNLGEEPLPEEADVQNQPEVEAEEVEVKKIGSTMKLDEALRALLHLETPPDQRDTEDMSALAAQLEEVDSTEDDLAGLEGAMAEIEEVSEYDVVEPRKKAPKVDMDPDLEELLPDPEFEIEDELESVEEFGTDESEIEEFEIEESEVEELDLEEDPALALIDAEEIEGVEDEEIEIENSETEDDAMETAETEDAEAETEALDAPKEDGEKEEPVALEIRNKKEVAAEAKLAESLIMKAFEEEEAASGIHLETSADGIMSNEGDDEQIEGQLSLADLIEGFQLTEQDEKEKPETERLAVEVSETEAFEAKKAEEKESEAKVPEAKKLETKAPEVKTSEVKKFEKKPSKAEEAEEEEPILPPDILQLIEEIENGIPAEHEEEPGENLQMKDLGDFEDYDEDADDEFEDALLGDFGEDVEEELTDEAEEVFEEEFVEELAEEEIEDESEEDWDESEEELAELTEEETEETYEEESAEDWDEAEEDFEEALEEQFEDESREETEEEPAEDEGWEDAEETYEEDIEEESEEELSEEEAWDETDEGFEEESEEELTEDGAWDEAEEGYEEEPDEGWDEDEAYEEESDEDWDEDEAYEEESDEDWDEDEAYEEESDEDWDEEDEAYEEESDEDWDEEDEAYEEESDEDWEEAEEEPVKKARPVKRAEEYDDREVPDEDDDKINFLSETAPLSRKETAKLYATGKTAPIPVDEISNALSMSDTGFVVHGRYDLKVQSGIGTRAGLTDDQKKLFSYFVPVRGMSEQLVDVLEQDKNCTTRNGTSATGNLLIIGNKGNGKTVLAVDVVKAIQKQRNIRQGRVAIVSGDSLNKKRISDIFSKLHAGALIIEKAGKMNEKTVARLNKAMEQETGELLVVLEDQRKPLDRLLTSNREFRRKFTSRLEVPILINDELVTFGQTYAKENGYLIDEMGILALYSRIDELQREDHPLTIAEVKEIMDQAMEHSQKVSAKKLMRRVFGRGTDSNDRIILGEADFNA